MGQLVTVGDYTFDAGRVLSICPAGTGKGNPPDLSRILIHLDMGQWTATYEFDGNVYSLRYIRETIGSAMGLNGEFRTPVLFVSPEYKSAIHKLDTVMHDKTIRQVTLTDDESRSVLDVCLQVTPEV